MRGRATSQLGPSASIINQENAPTVLSTGQPGRGIFSIEFRFFLDDLTLCQVDKQTSKNKQRKPINQHNLFCEDSEKKQELIIVLRTSFLI